jgi:hypothetical protein
VFLKENNRSAFFMRRKIRGKLLYKQLLAFKIM